jgi:hypothetical protein
MRWGKHIWGATIIVAVVGLLLGTGRVVQGQPFVPIFVTRIIFGSTAGVVIRSSTGTPEAAVTAPIGSLFLRSDGGAGTAVYAKESGSGNTGWAALSGSGGTVTASSSNTFTNKTIDAEGTGNVITIPFTVDWPGATCENGTPYSVWSAASGELPTPTCVTGANQVFAQADYGDGATFAQRNHFRLPADWTGTVGAHILWKTAATSGSAVWQVSTICMASGESVDPTFNAAATVTDAAIGTTNRLNEATIASLTTTGCAAGEWFSFAVFRDPAHASDTLAATASLVNFQLTYRRAM